MFPETIAILGTFSGILIGGVINYLASRSVKNQEWRLALAKDQSAIRHKLYSEFLVESQRLVLESVEKKISLLTDFNILNGKFAEVSLIAPNDVVEAAKKLADYAITSHSAQPAKEEVNFYKLKEVFIVAARKDIAGVLKGEP